jgi:uncharacterized protein
MRKFCYTILLFAPLLVSAQNKPLKILFDITSKDTLTQQTVVRHVTGMAKSYPDAELEVVIYGGALPMVVAGKSNVAKGIAQLAANKNVSFKVCEVTMKKYNVDKSQLLPGIQVVPDAIIELVMKQGEGWGYIKESHN